ncbi:protein wech [Hermetia illucens]|nr:protein wech [Hermetia illucens]
MFDPSMPMSSNSLNINLENIDLCEVFGVRRSSTSSPGSGQSKNSFQCTWCEINSAGRCLDCNETLCNDCLTNHRHIPSMENHTLLLENNSQMFCNLLCEAHKEVYTFVCETCRKLVCQCCTIRDHPGHTYVPLSTYINTAMTKVETALDSTKLGTKCVKGSIDRALHFSRAIERDANDMVQQIRKSFRVIYTAVEERERQLLEMVERFRQRKQTQFSEQTAGLRSALSGLAQNAEMMTKVGNNLTRMDPVEVAHIITKSQCQLEQFALIYQDLQPKQEFYIYVPPSITLASEIRSQADVVISDTKVVPGSSNFAAAVGAGRRPIMRDYTELTPQQLADCETAFSIGAVPVKTPGPAVRIGQCIPGSYEKVSVRKSPMPTRTFATDGHEDGQVSRPWGVCVDKEGTVYISDRRNNRVQVFTGDGVFKFKFGCKGAGNGQFDLPAGICIDCDSRIIVVDKDNHRVQIFSSMGRFLNKFGCFGREFGQFQYPWDVAVNTRRQIVVTDSRNHRIQQFDSEGRFIKHFIFDNFTHCKGPSSPRGVCFTPGGEIIVSDFDNHCLMLLDSDMANILAAKGHEGSGVQEFNRPSGLCCDDDGNIIVADSKNQRVLVFTGGLEYLWTIEIRPSLNPHYTSSLDEKDRPCDVALLPDGRIVIMVELSPDARDSSNPLKKFVQIY